MSTWLDHRRPRYLVKYYFRMRLWVCFGKRSAFEQAGRVKCLALPSVGGCQLICWGPEWNRKVEEGRICPLCLTAAPRHWFPQLSGLSTQTGSTPSLVLGLVNYITNPPGSHHIGGILWDFSAPVIQSCEPTLYNKSLSPYQYLPPVGSVSLENQNSSRQSADAHSGPLGSHHLAQLILAPTQGPLQAWWPLVTVSLSLPLR